MVNALRKIVQARLLVDEKGEITMVENIHMDSKMRALALKKAIEKACIAHGLNLTIYDGRIGFVDQEEGKIVMLWGARYNIDDLYDAYEIQAPEEGGNGNA